MKKIILSLVVAFLSLVSTAQKPEYFRAMGETLSQFSTVGSVPEMQALGNRFEMIAIAEKTEWLPFYYHAQCYILLSFMEQGDASKRDSYLDVAEKSVMKVLEMAPAETEAFVLHSFLLIGRLVINPMERGQEYVSLVNQSNAKALSLDPANPRAKMLEIQLHMGSASFMGTDPKSLCPQARALLANWDNYKLKSPLHPNWGKKQMEEIVKGCQ